MKAVWKFVIHPYAMNMMPVGAKPLSVHAQGDDLFLWALVDTEAELEDREFVIVGTGHELPDHAGEFLGTALLADGRLVLHVFEAK
jgi:hypothetical protein